MTQHCSDVYSLNEGETGRLSLDDGTEVEATLVESKEFSDPDPNSTSMGEILTFVIDGETYSIQVDGSVGSMTQFPLGYKDEETTLGYVQSVEQI